MASTYLDSLSDEDLELFEKAVSAQTTLVSGDGQDAVALSRIIKGAPAIGKAIIIYRYYDAKSPEVETGHALYSFKEPAFLFGSTKKLPAKDGAVILAFKIPSGMPGIEVTDTKAPGGTGAYLFDRALTVYFVPDGSGVYSATVAEAFQDGKALTASAPPPTMRLNTGYIPPTGQEDQYDKPLVVCDECGEIGLSGEDIEEFFNRCHGKGGLFCAGRGGRGGRGRGGGGQGNRRPQNHGDRGPGDRGPNHRDQGKGRPLTKGQKAEQRLQRTANIIRGVTAVVGVVMTVAAVIRAVDDIKGMKSKKADREQNRADQTIRRRNDLLGLREREGRAGLNKTPLFRDDKRGREDKALHDFLTS